MKIIVPRFTLGCVALVTAVSMLQSDEVMTVSGSEEGLDLQAVGELFKATAGLDGFEYKLNDQSEGVNNLDLNEDGLVDYIRVIEEGDTHQRTITLQAVLGDDLFQDVAYIEIEKDDEGAVNLQIRGSVAVYGPDYYYHPAVVGLQWWPIHVRIFAPDYRLYRSNWYWKHYPKKWRPYGIVRGSTYRARVVKYHQRKLYQFNPKPRLKKAPNKAAPKVKRPIKPKKVVKPPKPKRP
jgi:hypothetical protein